MGRGSVTEGGLVVTAERHSGGWVRKTGLRRVGARGLRGLAPEPRVGPSCSQGHGGAEGPLHTSTVPSGLG